MRLIKKTLWRAYLLYTRFRWKLGSSACSLLGKSFKDDYRNWNIPVGKIWKIHRRGFTVSDWCFMGITEENHTEFLSSVDYYRLHPINGHYSRWIDDKLTLKYLCSGTQLDRYMPEYYYQIDENGSILRLMDAPPGQGELTADKVAQLLQDKGVLAIKLIAGSIGEGFYKAEYADGTYLLNGERMDQQQFCSRIQKLRNYLIIEYLRPHEEIAAFCPETVNCIRYLVGRVNGQLKMLKGFIRFGTKCSGFVENYNAGGVLCYLDPDGYFFQGNVISNDRLCNCIVREHPDSGKVLCGRIPMWEEILKASETFGACFPQMQYMGLDFVVTSDHRVKILEINSLTSLDSLQIDGSIWKTEAADFFKKQIAR